MKVDIVRVSRRLPWPPWAVWIVLIWSALGAGILWLSFHFGRPVQLCLMKNLTGIPCPTCGFTRGMLSFWDGQILRAWLYNPLLFTVLGFFVVLAAFRIIFVRSIRIHLTKRERYAAWVAAAALVVSNWTYVILRDARF
jgi:hypothetical protein